jgi:hypothetical protein
MFSFISGRFIESLGGLRRPVITGLSMLRGLFLALILSSLTVGASSAHEVEEARFLEREEDQAAEVIDFAEPLSLFPGSVQGSQVVRSHPEREGSVSLISLATITKDLLPLESNHIVLDQANQHPKAAEFPSLEEFRRQVTNGEGGRITGVWVEGVLAFRVQAGTTRIAPSRRDTVSIYDWAERHGVTAFLVHNYLGGTKLYQLNPGVRIAVIYGNGGVDWYISRGGAWYESRTYSPDGFKGPFRVWSCKNCPYDISVKDILWRYYAGNPHIALQTCVEAEGRNGLMIVEAYLDVDRDTKSTTSTSTEVTCAPYTGPLCRP